MVHMHEDFAYLIPTVVVEMKTERTLVEESLRAYKMEW